MNAFELLPTKPIVGSKVGRRVLAACDHCAEDRCLVASTWLNAWLCTYCKGREYALQPHKGGARPPPKFAWVVASIESSSPRANSRDAAFHAAAPRAPGSLPHRGGSKLAGSPIHGDPAVSLSPHANLLGGLNA